VGYRIAKFCSKKCQNKNRDKKYWAQKIEKSHIEFPFELMPESYVECKICKYRSKDLAQHPSIHGMSQIEYREKYGEIKSKYKIDSIKGENNPWFNHGGTLSPFSKKFINYTSDDYIKELKKTAKETQASNHNNPLTIDYYLNRKFSIEESAEKLRNRQTTFSLEKCIKRYGEEDGRKRWNQRQEKWLLTLYSKSIEEKLEINKKKSTKINYKTLWSQSITKPGNLYLIKILERSYKIGITSKPSIFNRYKQSDLQTCKVMFFEEINTLNSAFQIEQLIKKKYSNKIIKDDYGAFGWTEVINDISDTEIMHEINILKNNLKTTEELFNKEFKKNAF
jgi:hypothetical protein